MIALIGGTSNGTGNVFARNPTTGIYGPVCDDFWEIADVITLDILYHFNFNFFSNYLTLNN